MTSAQIGENSIYILSSLAMLQLSDTYHVFTAPDDAPPCEVYNFSVTATPVSIGATYTGDGCSVPSPVLSRMLPSLPDINVLESSLNYSLMKLANKADTAIALTATFMVCHCTVYAHVHILYVNFVYIRNYYIVSRLL